MAQASCRLNLEFWKNIRVGITGHTGFKGRWLCMLLNVLGAKIHGFSHGQCNDSNLLGEVKLFSNVTNTKGDIRNYKQINDWLIATKPEIIIHLAAQPIVIESIKNPIETYSTNVSGTINLLEAIRLSNLRSNVLCVTTDKVYKPKSKLEYLKEESPLGGLDPYSCSKSLVEFICASYNHTYFNSNNDKIKLFTGRAGNVIGGGDWSNNRIIPDLMRAVFNNQKMVIRNPDAVRPWQHVLEPLIGYLLMVEKHAIDNSYDVKSINFGPGPASHKTVAELVNEAQKYINKNINVEFKKSSFNETKLLHLDTTKAYKELCWKQQMGFEETVRETILWYDCFLNNKNEVTRFTEDQIRRIINNEV